MNMKIAITSCRVKFSFERGKKRDYTLLQSKKLTAASIDLEKSKIYLMTYLKNKKGFFHEICNKLQSL